MFHATHRKVPALLGEVLISRKMVTALKTYDRDKLKAAKTQLESLRDLSDFCIKWEEIKPLISRDVLAQSELPDSSRRVVELLIQLTDRTAIMPAPYRD